MPQKKYRFIEDPGHGWIEVPVSELVKLGIADKITCYSYQSRDGKTAYLEEDCDLSTFAKAKGWTPKNAEQNWKSYYQAKTFVRLLPAYETPQPDIRNRLARRHVRTLGRRAQP